VSDSARSILGGETMRAYVADWSKLGSGEAPWTAAGALVDVLDVADLESEADHEYELHGAREGEQVAHEGSPQGAPSESLVDGGRTHRTVDRFVAHLTPGVAARGVVRIDGGAGTHVHVLAGGEPIGAFDVGDDEDWVERTFDVPSGAAGARTRIELRASGGAMTTFHYWFATVTPD
jgi:hypothetical protein